MIYKKSEIAFVHIPRTGGVSIIDAFGCEFRQHRRWDYYKRYLNLNYKIFTVVRNPYDRFISAVSYSQQKQGIGKDNHYHPDYLYFANKSWSECVDILYNVSHELMNQSFWHQYPWIYGNGFMVDKMLRFENLNQDFEEMKKDWNIKTKQLEKKNKTEHPNWRNCLTKEDKYKLYKHYQQDFELLGYNGDW